MNHETYSLCLSLLEVMDCNQELRDETELYGSWFNHMVDNMVDYEKEHLAQTELVKILRKQLKDKNK